MIAMGMQMVSVDEAMYELQWLFLALFLRQKYLPMICWKINVSFIRIHMLLLSK